MYSTCLFCSNGLGTNEVVEAFPVGRRLAFNQAKGRLWVVCRRCEKWNLSPLEERWDAIEDCERLFRDARKRVSTDNVGLARLNEGLELVRIGAPQRPEFAAWRYGDQFGRRMRRHLGWTVAAGAVAVGALAVGPTIGFWGIAAYGSIDMMTWGRALVRRRKQLAQIRTDDGSSITVRGSDAEWARLVISDDAAGWGLHLKVEGRELKLHGSEAQQATALIVPHLTYRGATRRETQDAVGRIEAAGDPGEYLRWLVHNQHALWLDPKMYGWKRSEASAGNTSLSAQGHRVCLAVEMAVNEENERRMLEGQLALLEAAWKDADEVAGIADSLLLPEEIDRQLTQVKEGSGKARGGGVPDA